MHSTGKIAEYYLPYSYHTQSGSCHKCIHVKALAARLFEFTTRFDCFEAHLSYSNLCLWLKFQKTEIQLFEKYVKTANMMMGKRETQNYLVTLNDTVCPRVFPV